VAIAAGFAAVGVAILLAAASCLSGLLGVLFAVEAKPVKEEEELGRRAMTGDVIDDDDDDDEEGAAVEVLCRDTWL